MHHILIVDDDPDLLFIVSQMIAFHEMTVKSISRGEEVIPSLENEHFDAVLMDIFIETYDGRALTRQLKDDPRFSHIPVLLYSAGVIEQSSIDNSGADGFIKKPFEMNELISRLQGLVSPGYSTA